jgi:hypothetical protein
MFSAAVVDSFWACAADSSCSSATATSIIPNLAKVISRISIP